MVDEDENMDVVKARCFIYQQFKDIIENEADDGRMKHSNFLRYTSVSDASSIREVLNLHLIVSEMDILKRYLMF